MPCCYLRAIVHYWGIVIWKIQVIGVFKFLEVWSVSCNIWYLYLECASSLLPSGEKGELGAVGCVYTTSYIEEFKVLTRTDVLPHDLYVFISVTSRVLMQKAQSMLQFMLNYSFPHAASFHHRDSLSTSYSPIVGPAAERGIEQQDLMGFLLVGRQRGRTENLTSHTSTVTVRVQKWPWHIKEWSVWSLLNGKLLLAQRLLNSDFTETLTLLK